MKFFKKPLVAVLLCVLIVIASTLLSVDIHFGKKCRQVSDSFFDGTDYKGYTRNSVASHLRNISAYADGIVTIASNYELDTGEVSEANSELKMALSYSKEYAGYIYRCYDELINSVNRLCDKLTRLDLEERDESGLEQYMSSIDGAQTAINDSGYNESVREFIREYDTFPTNLLAPLAGIEMPELFE